MESIVRNPHEMTLCWGCKNTHKDKCSWFNPDDPQPVPGWVAELRPKYRIGESYMVKECPKLDPIPGYETPAQQVCKRGVTRQKRGWAARIKHRNKNYYLGHFKTEDEALAARKAAEEAIARGEEPQRIKQEVNT